MSQNNLKNIIGNYEAFIEDCLQALQKLNISITSYEIDHLGYRIKTNEEYENKKIELKQLSQAYIENIFHDRPISKFILKEPIKYKEFRINLIELPSPKKDKSYETGLEHLEIAVGKDYEKLKNLNIWHQIEDSNAKNETLCLKTNGNKTIKFHRLPLKEIIELDGNKFTELK